MLASAACGLGNKMFANENLKETEALLFCILFCVPTYRSSENQKKLGPPAPSPVSGFVLLCLVVRPMILLVTVMLTVKFY